MGIVERVVARYLEARKQAPKVPAINKTKDRVVYVLPTTLEEDSATYEAVPDDDEDHIKNKGKPQRPARPRKPKRPRKPSLPRAVDPAPQRPAHRPMPVLPVPKVPKVKLVPPVKTPAENLDENRKWKIKKQKPLQARVLERHLARIIPLESDPS
jgi:hypothetical protein